MAFTAAYRSTAEEGWYSQTLNGYRLVGTETTGWAPLMVGGTVSFNGGMKGWKKTTGKSGD